MSIIPPPGQSAFRKLNSPSSIRAVTFDVGGTLIEPYPSVGHVYAKVASRHGISLSPEALNRQFAAAWRAKKDFAHSRSDWSELVDATFAGLTDTPPSRTFFPALYHEFSSPLAWRIYEDVLPALKLLRGRGLKLGIISNWDERLRPLLRVLELDGWFDAIGISVEIGQPKPNPLPFQRVAAQLQVEPASILHMGDSRVEDLEAARAAGFQARLIRRAEPAVPGDSIGVLTEVELLL
jgi:putative hydrolase of the HAD superfamily